MIVVDIDELTLCLKDNLTGEIVNTEVIPIKRRSLLSRFTKRNGWYANWEDLADKSEIPQNA